MPKNKRDSDRHFEVSDEELSQTSGGGFVDFLRSCGRAWSKASESGGMRGEQIGNAISAGLTMAELPTKYNNYNNPKDDKK